MIIYNNTKCHSRCCWAVLRWVVFYKVKNISFCAQLLNSSLLVLLHVTWRAYCSILVLCVNLIQFSCGFVAVSNWYPLEREIVWNCTTTVNLWNGGCVLYVYVCLLTSVFSRRGYKRRWRVRPLNVRPPPLPGFWEYVERLIRGTINRWRGIHISQEAGLYLDVIWFSMVLVFYSRNWTSKLRVFPFISTLRS